MVHENIMTNVKWYINGCIRTFFHFLPGFNNVFYVKQLILRLSGIKNIKLLKSYDHFKTAAQKK